MMAIYRPTLKGLRRGIFGPSVLPLSRVTQSVQLFASEFKAASREGIFLRRKGLSYADVKLYATQTAILASILSVVFVGLAAAKLYQGPDSTLDYAVFLGVLSLVFWLVYGWALLVMQRLLKQERETPQEE